MHWPAPITGLQQDPSHDLGQPLHVTDANIPRKAHNRDHPYSRMPCDTRNTTLPATQQPRIPIHYLPGAQQQTGTPAATQGSETLPSCTGGAEGHHQLWQHCTASHCGQRLLCTACTALLTAPALLDCQQCTACTCFANATSSGCRVVLPLCSALQMLREQQPTAESTAKHYNRFPKGSSCFLLQAAGVQQAVSCKGKRGPMPAVAPGLQWHPLRRGTAVHLLLQS